MEKRTLHPEDPETNVSEVKKILINDP